MVLKLVNWKFCILGAVLVVAAYIIGGSIAYAFGSVLGVIISGIIVGYLVNNGFRNGAINGFIAGFIGGLIIGIYFYYQVSYDPYRLVLGLIFSIISVGVSYAIFATVGGIIGSFIKITK